MSWSVESAEIFFIYSVGAMLISFPFVAFLSALCVGTSSKDYWF